MRQPLAYETSRDYKRLKELLDAGKEVVCFTTYDFFRHNREEHEPYMTTDVCYAVKRTNGTYDFSVRGTGYGDYDPSFHKFSFEDFCEKRLDLEFIDINPTAQ